MRIRNTTKNRILIIGDARIFPERSAVVPKSSWESYISTKAGAIYASKYLEVIDQAKKDSKKTESKKLKSNAKDDKGK